MKWGLSLEGDSERVPLLHGSYSTYQNCLTKRYANPVAIQGIRYSSMLFSNVVDLMRCFFRGLKAYGLFYVTQIIECRVAMRFLCHCLSVSFARYDI